MLGLDLEMTRKFKKLLYDGYEMFRLAYTRINFAWFFNDDDVEYVIQAIKFVCQYGWMFMPHYKFCKDQNIWVKRVDKETPLKMKLSVDYSSG